MNFETMANTIRTRMQDEFVAKNDDIACLYDNQDDISDDPAQGAIKPDPDKSFVRATILPGQSFQVTCGASQRFRNPGLLIIQVFVPLGDGDKAAWALADKLVTVFRAVSVSGLTFRTPYPQLIGRSNGWWQINVNCPYYADDLS